MIASYSFWSIKTLFLRSRLNHWYKNLKSYDDLWEPDVISVTDIIEHSIIHLTIYNFSPIVVKAVFFQTWFFPITISISSQPHLTNILIPFYFSVSAFIYLLMYQLSIYLSIIYLSICLFAVCLSIIHPSLALASL